MKVIGAVAITVVVVLLLLWSLASNNTSPQTAASSTEAGKVMESAPVHQVNHLNKLTVDAAGCLCVLGCDDPRVRYDMCQADAHFNASGERVNWFLGCDMRWATCMALTPNEDYSFEIIQGAPECRRTVMGREIRTRCVKIHARPYDAIYTATQQREKR